MLELRFYGEHSLNTVMFGCVHSFIWVWMYLFRDTAAIAFVRLIIATRNNVVVAAGHVFVHWIEWQQFLLLIQLTDLRFGLVLPIAAGGYRISLIANRIVINQSRDTWNRTWVRVNVYVCIYVSVCVCVVKRGNWISDGFSGCLLSRYILYHCIYHYLGLVILLKWTIFIGIFFLFEMDSRSIRVKIYGHYNFFVFSLFWPLILSPF